jgi:hypothetical protein
MVPNLGSTFLLEAIQDSLNYSQIDYEKKLFIITDGLIAEQ